jgi:putative copper resistance protein D
MSDNPDALSVVFRAISFTLLLNAAGIPIFIAAFGRLLPSSVPAVSKLGWKLAIGALLFVAAHHVLEAARMTGEMSGVMDLAMQKMALQSRAGAAFAMRVLGLALVAGGLRRAPRLALLGSLLSVTAFTLVGHTVTTPHRLAAAVLITLHLLVVAFWLGALWPLYLAATREQPSVIASVINAFSVAAAWVVPLILLAGIGLTVVLVPSFSTFRQPYGQLLLVKVGLFAVLMAIASLNKWRFGPACAEGDTAAFKRTVLIEYVLICLVLAVTATMTTFYSPEVA